MNHKPRKDTVPIHCDVHIKLSKKIEGVASQRGWTLRMTVEHIIQDFFTRLDGKDPMAPEPKKFVQ